MKRRNGKVWRCAHCAFEQLEPRLMLAAQPIISEFMASNSSSIQDGFGHHSDWIELTNTGDARRSTFKATTSATASTT